MSAPLAPRPGFCVKSRVVKETIVNQNFHSITIPSGSKIFINIAWDKNVDPPPFATQETIQRAVSGLGDWPVPVVISEVIRRDVDKAGILAFVLDAVYNSSLKHKSDISFKLFLVEHAFQHIESQYPILLSREISTPNIASKGPLAPRSVATASPTTNHNTNTVISPPHHSEQPPRRENLLFPSDGLSSSEQPSSGNSTERTPIWSWSKVDNTILITISVPDLPPLERSHIHKASLDLEAHRLLLHVPSFYSLDINLGLPDADITNSLSSPSSPSVIDNAIRTTQLRHFLTLKRARQFDIHNALAEWRTAEGVILVYL